VIAGRQFLLRASLAFAHDVAAAGVAWLAAFWLRFELELPPAEFTRVALTTLPAVLAVHALAFWILGLYRGLWRYASLPDLQRIMVAVAVAALAVPALFTLVVLETPVPRSVYLIMPVLLIGAMCGSRLLYRAWKERRLLGMAITACATPSPCAIVPTSSSAPRIFTPWISLPRLPTSSSSRPTTRH